MFCKDCMYTTEEKGDKCPWCKSTNVEPLGCDDCDTQEGVKLSDYTIDVAGEEIRVPLCAKCLVDREDPAYW